MKLYYLIKRFAQNSQLRAYVPLKSGFIIPLYNTLVVVPFASTLILILPLLHNSPIILI
jgi:hypothetical protein